MRQGAGARRPPVGIAGNRQETSSTARFSASIGGRPRAQRRLVEETVGDFAGAAPADRVDAGDGEQILDQRLGAGVIGALQRRQHAGLGERALAGRLKMASRLRPRATPRRSRRRQTSGMFERIRARRRTGRRRRAAPRARPRPPRPPASIASAKISASAASASRRPKLSSPVCVCSPPWAPRGAEHRAEIGIFGASRRPCREAR